MGKETEQMRQWMGTFGEEYTQRNAFTFEEFEEFSKKRFGLTRTEMNKRFLKDISRSVKILEAGANIGNQLQCLQKMGFQNLYGIELQAPAVEISKQRTSGINLIQGSAFDIPFKDNYFN
ncbi:MAG: methyltransferase domain-containing protein [Candidatus Omnitrophica bacterium]|nr:methyltransferase domain-containing protein [Candidatus Omnitrophota bacterium]